MSHRANLLAAAEHVEALRTCHERVACPRCKAPVGERCHEMPAGYAGGRTRLLAHRERWTQELSPR